MRYFIILLAFFICSFEAEAYDWFEPDVSIHVQEDVVTFTIHNYTRFTLVCEGHITIKSRANEYKHREVDFNLPSGLYYQIPFKTFANRQLVAGETQLKCRI